MSISNNKDLICCYIILKSTIVPLSIYPGSFLSHHSGAVQTLSLCLCSHVIMCIHYWLLTQNPLSSFYSSCKSLGQCLYEAQDHQLHVRDSRPTTYESGRHPGRDSSKPAGVQSVFWEVLHSETRPHAPKSSLWPRAVSQMHLCTFPPWKPEAGVSFL